MDLNEIIMQRLEKNTKQGDKVEDLCKVLYGSDQIVRISRAREAKKLRVLYNDAISE